jgi:hypothetical protein
MAAALLRLKDFDQQVSLTPAARGARDRVMPCGGVRRVPGEKVGNAGKVEGVVGCEPPDPREAANINGKTTTRCGVPDV